MPIINVSKAFKYSEDGLHVILIEEGEQEVSEQCAQVAVEQLKVAEYAGNNEHQHNKLADEEKGNGDENQDNQPKPSKKPSSRKS